MTVESRRLSRRKWKLANPDKVKAERKRFRERHRERLKIRDRAHYLSYKATHAEEMREVAKRTRETLKVSILEHYGHGEVKCVQCGENRIACLSIDHINNDGNSHRGGQGRSGYPLYRWLRDNNYPLGYQTLCMNCQWIKKADSGRDGHHTTGDTVRMKDPKTGEIKVVTL